MASLYAEMIGVRLAGLGRSDVNPAHVEGWMRLEKGTLDNMSRDQFTDEVKMAVACIDASTPAENDSLAASYGLSVARQCTNCGESYTRDRQCFDHCRDCIPDAIAATIKTPADLRKFQRAQGADV